MYVGSGYFRQTEMHRNRMLQSLWLVPLGITLLLTTGYWTNYHRIHPSKAKTLILEQRDSSVMKTSTNLALFSKTRHFHISSIPTILGKILLKCPGKLITDTPNKYNSPLLCGILQLFRFNIMSNMFTDICHGQVVPFPVTESSINEYVHTAHFRITLCLSSDIHCWPLQALLT